MNKDELKKGVKELVIALLKCKPTKDKEIIDFNVRAFMGGFEDYLSNQSVSDEEIDKEAIRFCKEHYPEYDDITKEIEVFDHAIFWMRDTPTPKNWVKLKSISRIRLVEHYKKFHGVSGVAEENQIDIDWAGEVIKSLCTPIKEQGETKSTSPTEVKVDYIEPKCEICKHFGKPEEYPCNDCSTQSIHFKPKELEEKVICPHCTAKISQEELDMFGGYCEACNEELDH